MTGDKKTEAVCKPWWADWTLSLLKTIIPVILLIAGGGYLGMDSLKAHVGSGVVEDARTEAIAIDKRVAEAIAKQVNEALDEIAAALDEALAGIDDELAALDEAILDVEEAEQDIAGDLKALREQLGIARAAMLKMYASAGDHPPGGPPDRMAIEDDLPPTAGELEEREREAEAVERVEDAPVAPERKRGPIKREKRVEINDTIFQTETE